MVRFLVPLRRTASMRCSGTPQRPKPPTKMVAPSPSFAMAASAEAMRLSMKVISAGRRVLPGGRVYCKQKRGCRACAAPEKLGGAELVGMSVAELFLCAPCTKPRRRVLKLCSWGKWRCFVHLESGGKTAALQILEAEGGTPGGQRR